VLANEALEAALDESSRPLSPGDAWLFAVQVYVLGPLSFFERMAEHLADA
jgi:hypothetical protein